MIRSPSKAMRTAICLLSVQCSSLASAEQAIDGIEFGYAFDSKCVTRNGKMMLLRNTHPHRAVKIYLQRYLGEMRQPGRQVEVLEPGGETGLGCTLVGGQPQTWKLVKAGFVR